MIPLRQWINIWPSILSDSLRPRVVGVMTAVTWLPQVPDVRKRIVKWWQQTYM